MNAAKESHRIFQGQRLLWASCLLALIPVVLFFAASHLRTKQQGRAFPAASSSAPLLPSQQG